MKNFTRLFAIAAFVASGFTASAQFDVGCTSIDAPAPNTVIYNNIGFTPQYTRENFGQDIPVNSNDIVTMEISANGTILATLNRTNMVAFLNGDVEMTGAAAPVDFAPANLTPGPFEFCVVARFPGDIDASNDSSCITLVSGGNLDVNFGVTNVTLVSPTNNEITAGNGIEQMSITVQNFASDTIRDGYVLDMESSTPAETIPWFLIFGVDLAPGDDVQLDFDVTDPNDEPLIPDVPSASGPTVICASTADAADVNPLNDEFCLNIDIVAPPAPTITSIDPEAGVIGREVTITGTNFSPVSNENTVFFNGTSSTVSVASATELTTTVPVGATTGDVSVEVDQGFGPQTATGPQFTVLASDPNNPEWPLSIGENEIRIGSAFYAEGNLNVNFFNTTNADVATLTVTNMNGQVISNKQVSVKGASNLQETISLNVAKGVYILNIETNNGVSQQTRFSAVN